MKMACIVIVFEPVNIYCSQMNCSFFYLNDILNYCGLKMVTGSRRWLPASSIRATWKLRLQHCIIISTFGIYSLQSAVKLLGLLLCQCSLISTYILSIIYTSLLEELLYVCFIIHICLCIFWILVVRSRGGSQESWCVCWTLSRYLVDMIEIFMLSGAASALHSNRVSS